MRTAHPSQLIRSTWESFMQVGNLESRDIWFQLYLFFQRHLDMFRVLRNRSAGSAPETWTDWFCVDDSSLRCVKSVAMEFFAGCNDINNAFWNLFAFLLLSLHGLLSHALFYKLLGNFLPQWSNDKESLTKCRLPFFSHFLSFSTQVLKVPFSTPWPKSVLTVNYGTVDTEVMTMCCHDLDLRFQDFLEMLKADVCHCRER